MLCESGLQNHFSAKHIITFSVCRGPMEMQRNTKKALVSVVHLEGGAQRRSPEDRLGRATLCAPPSQSVVKHTTFWSFQTSMTPKGYYICNTLRGWCAEGGPRRRWSKYSLNRFRTCRLLRFSRVAFLRASFVFIEGSREAGNPEVAQIEVFPRGNSILSNSVIHKVAQNGVLVEGFCV